MHKHENAIIQTIKKTTAYFISSLVNEQQRFEVVNGVSAYELYELLNNNSVDRGNCCVADDNDRTIGPQLISITIRITIKGMKRIITFVILAIKYRKRQDS